MPGYSTQGHRCTWIWTRNSRTCPSHERIGPVLPRFPDSRPTVDMRRSCHCGVLCRTAYADRGPIPRRRRNTVCRRDLFLCIIVVSRPTTGGCINCKYWTGQALSNEYRLTGQLRSSRTIPVDLWSASSFLQSAVDHSGSSAGASFTSNAASESEESTLLSPRERQGRAVDRYLVPRNHCNVYDSDQLLSTIMRRIIGQSFSEFKT